MIFLTDGKRHLIPFPYSIDNCHKMAEALNIKRCWFHSGKFPHYDIPKKRTEEIGLKCKLVSSEEIVKIIKEHVNNRVG
jgi:hypothetical protein